MPLDLSGNAKLYPDASMRFKWEHSDNGTIAARQQLNIRPTDCNGNPDHALSKAQGFMCNHLSDFRNVEQKIHFNGDDILLHLGGIGTESNPCTGFAYQMLFYGIGIISLRKKTYHGNISIMKTVDNGPLPAGMKGVAFARYNTNNGTMVRLEAWVDKDNHDTWKRALTILDDGNTYGTNGSRCGGEDRKAGTWGFPAVIFHNISNNDFDYENATVREINPGGVFNEAGGAKGKAPPRGGGGGNPLPELIT